MKLEYTRRQVLKSALGITGFAYMAAMDQFTHKKNKRFQIGACDWSINQMGKVKAITIAKKIGLDGVQVSMGTLKNNMHLREPTVQRQYKDACENHGISIGGLALGELNIIPYKSDRRAEKWVFDSIDVAKAMGTKVVLLPFFYNGDLKDDVEGTQMTIERLKKVMRKAEDNGIVLGIESWLDAKEHLHIIAEVNSPNLKVYYDVANSNKMGYNIYDEIRYLGKKNICEFHLKENGFLLGRGNIDFHKVHKAIEAIDYEGWIHIEGAVPENADMLESYIHNNAFIKSIFY